MTTTLSSEIKSSTKYNKNRSSLLLKGKSKTLQLQKGSKITRHILQTCSDENFGRTEANKNICTGVGLTTTKFSNNDKLNSKETKENDSNYLIKTSKSSHKFNTFLTNYKDLCPDLTNKVNNDTISRNKTTLLNQYLLLPQRTIKNAAILKTQAPSKSNISNLNTIQFSKTNFKYDNNEEEDSSTMISKYGKTKVMFQSEKIGESIG